MGSSIGLSPCETVKGKAVSVDGITSSERGHTHQVDDGQGEVAGVWAEKTSSTDVPSNGSRHNSKGTSSSRYGTDTSNVGNEEEQESEVEEEEQEDQTEGASERGHKLRGKRAQWDILRLNHHRSVLFSP